MSQEFKKWYAKTKPNYPINGFAYEAAKDAFNAGMGTGRTEVSARFRKQIQDEIRSDLEAAKAVREHIKTGEYDKIKIIVNAWIAELEGALE